MTDSILIRTTRDVLAHLGTRTERGDRITIELGEPVAIASLRDAPIEATSSGEVIETLPVYAPVFTQHADPGWRPGASDPVPGQMGLLDIAPERGDA